MAKFLGSPGHSRHSVYGLWDLTNQARDFIRLLFICVVLYLLH